MATNKQAAAKAPAKKAAAAKAPAKKPAAAKAPAKKPAAAKAPAKKAVAVSVKKAPEDISKLSMYFDFYGDMLSERQKEVYHSYYEENLSLSEIAQTAGTTRQAVHEAIKTTQIKLNGFEEALGLVSRHEAYLTTLKSIEDTAAKILQDEAIVSLKDKKDADRIKRNLRKIVSSVKSIE